MALTDIEIRKVRDLKAQGKSLSETVGMIGAMRAGAIVPETPKSDVRMLVESNDPTFLEGLGNAANRVGESFIDAGRTVSNDPTLTGLGAGFLQGAGGIGKGISGVAGAVLETADDLTGEVVSRNATAGIRAILDTELGREGIRLATEGGEAYAEFAKRNPTTAAALDGVGGILEGLGTVAGVGKGALLVGKGAKAVAPSIKVAKNATASVVSKAESKINQARSGVVNKFRSSGGVGVGSGRAGRLADLLSPKLTTKEKGRAISEGRVTAGKSVPFLGKFADQIDAPDNIKRLVDIIETDLKIKADDTVFTIRPKLAAAVADLSEELKPKLSAIELKKDLITDLKKRSAAFAKEQAEDPEFLAFAGSSKAQKNFLNFVEELGKEGKTYQDVWDARKAYDKTVSKSVKEAIDGQSAPSTVLQRDIWLQNRSLLNNAIEELGDGVGRDVRNSFEKMKYYYEGLQNIERKADVDQKGSFVINKSDIITGAATTAGLGGLVSIFSL